MFYSERTLDLSKYGWDNCKFVFNALSWAEQRKLDSARIEWQKPEADIEKAANSIVDIIKSKFVRGEALDENKKKFQVTKEQLEELPFDVLLGITAWLTSGEVNESLKAD